MAKDGFSLLVKMVEEEESLPQVKIWVIVPGGLIFGTLISEKAFAEYGHKNNRAGISLEEGILRAELQLFAAEMLEKYEAIFTDEQVEACLIDAQIISGGAVLCPERVRVRISDVCAWGMGTIPGDLLRPPQKTGQAS